MLYRLLSSVSQHALPLRSPISYSPHGTSQLILATLSVATTCLVLGFVMTVHSHVCCTLCCSQAVWPVCLQRQLSVLLQSQLGLSICTDSLACLCAKTAFAPTGQTTSALYSASEALRLGSTLFSSLSPDRAAVTALAQPSALPLSSSQQTSPSGAPSQPSHKSSSSAQDAVKDSMTDPSTEQAEDTTFAVESGPTESAVAQGRVRGKVGVDGVGYWQVTWLYLTSLLKLGEVYEVAGSHEDALHAFREGQELVRTTQLSL